MISAGRGRRLQCCGCVWPSVVESRGEVEDHGVGDLLSEEFLLAIQRRQEHLVCVVNDIIEEVQDPDRCGGRALGNTVGLLHWNRV